MTAESADTDLANRFRRLIRAHGPIPVSRYMGESNALYYASRDPLGAGGDFVTAPEISQMFGEMVGLWCADLWNRAGRPDAAWVELGPGRGTLAADAARAMASQGFAPPVHLVEGSPSLRELQSRALGQIRFHDSIDTLPEDRPLLVIANEFLDALPICQLVKTPVGWRERMVALNGDEFVFSAGPNPMDEAVPESLRSLPHGTVIETCPAAAALVEALARRIDIQGGAALFIDYGHLETRTGETLQAIRAHNKLGVFDAPGEMDITAHVDFASLAEIARREALAFDSTTQGGWLAAMGVDLRAEALAARAPDRAAEISAAHHRLVAPGEMGELFKVVAFTARDWPRAAGFG